MQGLYGQRVLRLGIFLGVAVVLAGGYPVIASADTPQNLEVTTVCNSKEPNDPYNYNVCVDETGIPSQFLPRSTTIIGAQWVAPQLAPALSGDHSQTTWGTDGNAYVALDDGLSGIATGHVIVKASGMPPSLTWSLVGSSNPVGFYPTITFSGYYMEGFTSVHGVWYATRMPFQWGTPLNSAPYFANTLYPYGLDGIAYSTDNGATWTLPPTDGSGYTLAASRFGPDLNVSGDVIKAPANLNFVQFDQDGGTAGSLTGNVNPNDGWIYAIFQDRERNADNIYLGAVYPDSPTDVVDPTKWEWYKGGGQWSSIGAYNISQAQPLISWSGTQSLDDSGGHFSYPEIHYDKAIGRFLLTFTYAYDTRASCDPAPPSDCSTYDKSAAGYADDGGELVILDAPALTGPYSFVARVKYFGPGNGYSVGIPPVFQGSKNGSYQDVWLKWAGNYAGCTGSGVGNQVLTKVDCGSGIYYYGYDMRQLRLTLADGTGTIVNPGFESGALAPWVLVGNGAVESSTVKSGSYAVQLTGPVGSWVEQTISGLIPGSLYTLTGYGMVSGDGSLLIGVYKYASGGSSAETDSAQITATTFTAGSVQFTPAGQTATVYCYRDTGTTGTSFCDELSVAVSPGTIVNPGFDSGALAPWVLHGNGAVESSAVKSGSYAVQLTGQGGSWVGQTLSGLTPGHLYTLTGYGMVSGDGSVRIGVYQYASGGSGETDSAQITATTFTAGSVTFTPAGQTATVYCWRDTGTTGTSYCDNFSLQ